MTNTPLSLTSGTLPGSGFGARDRDQVLEDFDNNFEAIDLFAGSVTGSMSVRFDTKAGLSGSAVDVLGESGGVLGAAYARNDRVIKGVVAWARASGSHGVSRIDVQTIPPGEATFRTIFSNNTFKPALSASLGNFGLARSETFVSGTNQVWAKGTLLRAILDTAAGGAPINLGDQKDVTVEVIYVPSGSYGV